MSNKTINLQLPALHPAQEQVVSEAKRFNVVCCGRRWGKTVLGMDRLIQTALQGKPVAWFGPMYKSVADTWRELCSLLAEITCSRNEQEKRLELIGGGVIDVWSLDSPDAGRGRKYAVVVIDEAAMIGNLSSFGWPTFSTRIATCVCIVFAPRKSRQQIPVPGEVIQRIRFGLHNYTHQNARETASLCRQTPSASRFGGRRATRRQSTASGQTVNVRVRGMKSVGTACKQRDCTCSPGVLNSNRRIVWKSEVPVNLG